VGTGGTSAVCQGSATQCSGNSVQTCTNGQWGTAVACGARQTCTGPVGTGHCTCNTDPVCSSVGGTCASASVLATCAQDADTCLYEQTATTCTNGACTGAAGAASCCTNACTAGVTCLSGTSLQTCAVAPNGCTASSTTTCSTGLVCERYGTAACLDPNWAEWPMPNSQLEVTAGAPNLENYTDNQDGTVTDNVTGLMWQQAVPTNSYNWANAVTYCSTTLTLAGHSDWRLPSIIELASIVDLGQSNPSINSTYFPSTPGTAFSSSSPWAGSSSYAWGVSFDFGYSGNVSVSYPIFVRCVR